jgi:DNA polymerase-3 subunit delta
LSIVVTTIDNRQSTIDNRFMPSVALKPAYALIGDDSFLQVQKLGEIIASAPKDAQRIDIDGERAELVDVLDELRSFAMFGGSKIVVVRSADDFISKFREQLEDYLDKPSDSATLILRVDSLPSNTRVYKLIQKHGVIEKCEPPKERELPAWITARAKSDHKITLSSEAASLLADRIGADLGRLDNELAKLAVSVENKKVEANDVAKSVSFQREQQMWDLTNALAAGNIKDALMRWRQLLSSDTSSEFRAVTWISIWLENVRKALAMKKSGMNENAIANALRIFPFDARPAFFKTTNSMGETRVAKAIDELTLLDRKSKSGLGEARDLVERFILSFGKSGTKPV